MADGVARSPSRLCSRDGKICCYGDALSTIFLLACFGSCFLIFVLRFSLLSFLNFFLHPGMCIFFVSLRLCSSHLLLSASTQFILVVRVLFACHLFPTPSRNSFVFLFVQFFLLFCFSQLLFLGWRFFCCALVPGTLAHDLPTLILQRLFFFSHCM